MCGRALHVAFMFSWQPNKINMEFGEGPNLIKIIFYCNCVVK